MSKNVDYIIVGQGLAGTCLALALLRRSKTIRIIDANEPVTSSKVAAGLYNPITGRKMVKTWMADELFPFLLDFYREQEVLTGKKFLNDTPIYRPFLSLEEQNEWMGKSATPAFEKFIDTVYDKSIAPPVNDTYGGIVLARSGYLDVAVFLEAMQEYFMASELLEKKQFSFEQLLVNEDSVEYDHITAGRIIFCDGSLWEDNIFFRWLPFRPVKGEVLEVKSSITLNYIVNRGVFCVPLGNNLFRVGSNYDNEDHSWAPTERAKNEIEKKLAGLINVPFETIHQKAGIRPSSRDRRPYIGLHPKMNHLGLFNGLGTKGVSLAPYFGEHFAACLETGEELNKEVNISRYFSLYYDSQN